MSMMDFLISFSFRQWAGLCLVIGLFIGVSGAYPLLGLFFSPYFFGVIQWLLEKTASHPVSDADVKRRTVDAAMRDFDRYCARDAKKKANQAQQQRQEQRRSTQPTPPFRLYRIFFFAVGVVSLFTVVFIVAVDGSMPPAPHHYQYVMELIVIIVGGLWGLLLTVITPVLAWRYRRVLALGFRTLLGGIPWPSKEKS